MDLYSDIILDYYKNPKNKGQMPDAQAHAKEHNPSCGDIIEIFIHFDENEKIDRVTFDGVGCAISQASTSMLTEDLIGKTREQALAIDNEEIYDMLGVEIGPGRVKCALLGLVAAKNALNHD